MSLFTRHSLLLQTAFSETKRRAMEQPFLLMGTPGSVGEREVGGRRFHYRQFYDAQGKKRADYLGPVADAEAERRTQSVREQIAVTGELIREARLLAQQGYARVDPRAGAILASLANHDLFRKGALLVGSHAYGAILNELAVKSAAFFTEDVDIARGEPLDITLGTGESFETILAGSTVPLGPIPPLDRKAPSTSFKAAGGGRFRVDLLVPTRESEVTVRAVPELRAHATALPYLAYLLGAPIESIALGREGVVPVKVPRPEAFTWHKMLVSQLRGATREKSGKDLSQAAVIFAVLAEDAPDALETAFARLPRSGRSRTQAAARQVLALLEKGSHERAAETMRSFL